MSKEIELNDFTFLVSETDEKGIITFASDSFCEIAEYTVDELIGKPHNLVRHPDMPKVAFQSLWETVQKGQVWTGFVKNLTKSGNYYWVYATVYPTVIADGKRGFLSCRRKASKKEVESHEKLYRTLI